MVKLGISVRAKLTLATVSVLALVYVLLGFTVQIAATKAIQISVDSGLERQADHFLDMWRHPPPPPGTPGFQGRAPPGPPPGDEGPPPPRPDGGPGFGGPGPQPFGGPSRVSQPSDQHQADLLNSPVTVWQRDGFDLPLFRIKAAYDLVPVSDATHGRRTLSTVIWDGQPLRVLTVGFPSRIEPGQYDAVVQFPYPMGDVQKTLASLARTLFLLLPVGLALVAAASLFIVGWSISPVREITRTTAHIEAESLGGRLSVRGRDEFAELAATINGMLERLEGAFTAQRTALERLREIVEQQRRFTADASHELKTPLSVIKAHAGLLQREKFKSADVEESVDAINAASDRMAALVRDLLLLARTDAGQLSDGFQQCDLKQVAARAIANVPGGCNVKLDSGPPSLTAYGSASALERVITNLLDNACRHSGPKPEVLLTLRGEPSQVVIEVSDSGEGISSEHLQKVFDRFYRVDSSRYSETGGSGLGLAICKGVVEAHNGTISVCSKPGQGSTFTVRLPVGS